MFHLGGSSYTVGKREGSREMGEGERREEREGRREEKGKGEERKEEEEGERGGKCANSL